MPHIYIYIGRWTQEYATMEPLAKEDAQHLDLCITQGSQSRRSIFTYILCHDISIIGIILEKDQSNSKRMAHI